MKVRPAKSLENGTLVAIWRKSVEATHAFLSPEDIDSLEVIVREQVLPNLEVWVLCADSDEPVGFMGLDGARLEALFISPSKFGKGGGRLMLAHARQLKGPLQVDVNEQNPQATAFYLANGFQVASRSALDSDGRPFPLLHLRDGTPNL